jgi:hypothetical protein
VEVGEGRGHGAEFVNVRGLAGARQSDIGNRLGCR